MPARPKRSTTFYLHVPTKPRPLKIRTSALRRSSALRDLAFRLTGMERQVFLVGECDDHEPTTRIVWPEMIELDPAGYAGEHIRVRERHFTVTIWCGDDDGYEMIDATVDTTIKMLKVAIEDLRGKGYDARTTAFMLGSDALLDHHYALDCMLDALPVKAVPLHPAASSSTSKHAV